MNLEQTKYERMWAHDAYRNVAPGEYHVAKFIEWAKPISEQTIADFGCGTGRGALRMFALTGASVTAIDFAANALDPEVRDSIGERFRFKQHDLTKPVGETFDFGFCTDVLEHIPPESVDTVLANITRSARRVYLAISTVEDHMGALINEPLHLTVQPFDWWREKLEAMHFRIDQSADLGEVAVFYGSIYASAQDFSDHSGINTAEETIKRNILANLALGMQEVAPHEKQPDTTVYLLAGGPSLADYEQQIVEFGRDGGPIVTVNGSYNWLLERGIRPAAQVLLDARAFNRRFISPLTDTTKYLVCSQCDNETVASLPRDQTWLWHSGDSEITKQALEEYCREHDQSREWFPVYGGSTVISRALVLLAMLGFRKVEVFGWDSCIRGDAHHAYPQKENDSKTIVEVTVGAKTFRCHPWMVCQANEFQKIVRYILGVMDDFEMVVHGDGLIAHLINHSAALSAKGI